MAHQPPAVAATREPINAKLVTTTVCSTTTVQKTLTALLFAAGFRHTLEEVIDYLNAHGEKVGLVKVRLLPPFSVSTFVDVLPESVKKIAVLEFRTKEPGSAGEPLRRRCFFPQVRHVQALRLLVVVTALVLATPHHHRAFATLRSSRLFSA